MRGILGEEKKGEVWGKVSVTAFGELHLKKGK